MLFFVIYVHTPRVSLARERKRVPCSHLTYIGRARWPLVSLLVTKTESKFKWDKKTAKILFFSLSLSL